MINRTNWKLTKEYLEYRSNVDLISDGSLQQEETHIRYLLEWAQNKSFLNVKDIRPTFPESLLKYHQDDQNGRLSETYIKKILATSRRFFTWLKDNKSGYRVIQQAWLKTLKTKRMPAIPRTSEAVSLDEILKIAAAPVYSTADRRARAMSCFLFLSGMRIGAFVSMPILAVDFQNRLVKQHPNLGVRTKNGKHATTYLLDLPELITVVQDWDNEVRAILPDFGMWFPALSPKTGEIDTNNLSSPKSRTSMATRQLKTYLNKIGLPYHSPHKFRHGHIHYGLKRSKNVADYKAVSQNVMHSSMNITDDFYSNLNGSEIQNRINSLGNKNQNLGDEEKLYQEFQEYIAWKESRKSS